jgi:hypothetical protein
VCEAFVAGCAVVAQNGDSPFHHCPITVSLRGLREQSVSTRIKKACRGALTCKNRGHDAEASCSAGASKELELVTDVSLARLLCSRVPFKLFIDCLLSNGLESGAKKRLAC